MELNSDKIAAMKRWISIVVLFIFIIISFATVPCGISAAGSYEQIPPTGYWFLLLRKSNRELFYLGNPGDATGSMLLNIFRVKTGIPGERPTPLPQLVGEKYWRIIAKNPEPADSETGPYFLTLDVPAPDGPPFGPAAYPECSGGCNWEVPGAFGLHGVGGDPARLKENDAGSSGCIRHSDVDITYLYHLINPQQSEIRYYIVDL